MPFNLEQKIIDNTQYKSKYTKREGEYVISASMVGKDLLQNYLSIIYGNHKNEKIDDTVLGTIFHNGLETMMKKGDPEATLYPEYALSKKLKNGWMVTGTTDLLVSTGDHYEIRDYKLTKQYALKMIKKDLHNHPYSKQLNVLNFLLGNRTGTVLWLDIFTKDAKAIENENSYEAINVPLVDRETMEKEIIEETTKLQEYIESGEIPEQCEDVWIRKLKNGTTIPTKCALYCSHGKAGLCPYYQPTTRESVKRIANW